MITNTKECEEAALILNLQATSSKDYMYQGLPYGCIYANTDWLNFASLNGHGYENLPCGTISGGIKYDCICKHGKTSLTCRQIPKHMQNIDIYDTDI